MSFTKEELKLLAVSGPTWIRMLRSRQERVIARMHAEFNSGSTDHLAYVAQIVSIREQINEITSALKQNENRSE